MEDNILLSSRIVGIKQTCRNRLLKCCDLGSILFYTFVEMEEDESDPQKQLEKTHRQEKQELQGRIMALKKSAAQGDKKKKKEINAEISKLEGDLNEKHSEEMMELLLNSVSVSDEVVENVKSIDDKKNEAVEREPRVSKAQKRREKKADKEEERRRDIERQEEENVTGARNREQEKIKELLEARGLELAEVPSDGDCMFAGLVHQVEFA